MAETEESIKVRLTELNYKLNRALQDHQETEAKQVEIDEILEAKTQTINNQAATIKLQEKIINDRIEELAAVQLSPDSELFEELREVKEDNAKLRKQNQQLAAEVQSLKTERQKLNQLVKDYDNGITILREEVKAVKTSFYNWKQAILIESIKKRVRKDCAPLLDILFRSPAEKGENGIYDYFQELLNVNTKTPKELSLTFLKKYPRFRPFTTEQVLALKSIEKRVSFGQYSTFFKDLNSVDDNFTNDILQADFFEPETPIGPNPSKFAFNFLEKHLHYYIPLGPRASAVLDFVMEKVENDDYVLIESAIHSSVQGNVTRKLFFELIGSSYTDSQAASQFVKRSTFDFKSFCAII